MPDATPFEGDFGDTPILVDYLSLPGTTRVVNLFAMPAPGDYHAILAFYFVSSSSTDRSAVVALSRISLRRQVTGSIIVIPARGGTTEIERTLTLDSGPSESAIGIAADPAVGTDSLGLTFANSGSQRGYFRIRGSVQYLPFPENF